MPSLSGEPGTNFLGTGKEEIFQGFPGQVDCTVMLGCCPPLDTRAEGDFRSLIV